MTFRLSLLALGVAAFAAQGCDQNAFEEDYPDPSTGAGPYAAFDFIALAADLDATCDEDASEAVIDNGGSAGTLALPVRLPTALGEDVTVTYTLGGSATRGTDYTVGGTPGTLVIDYDIDDDQTFEEDLELTVNAGATGDVVLTLTGARTASGEALNIGRLPTGCDETLRVTL